MSDDLVLIRLVDFPIALGARMNRHYEAIQRELALIQFSGDDARAALPSRLLAVAERVSNELAGAEVLGRDEVASAVAAGAPTVTVEARMPRAAGESIAELLALLSEADEFCRQGDLITVAMPPECCRLRDWSLREVVVQIAGAEPTPWTGPLE